MFIFILICSLVLFHNIAEGGAWLQKSGKSELITKHEYKTLSTYFIEPTTKIRYNSKTFFFQLYSIYYQYGFTDKFNIGLDEKWFNYLDYNQYYFRNDQAYEIIQDNELRLDSHYKKFENNPYSTKFFVQSLLWSNENSVISIKPAVEAYNRTYDQSFEITLLYGTNFKLGKKYSYVNLEYGVARNPYDVTEKLEVTLGIAVLENHTALLQFFCHKNIGILRDQNVDSGQFLWEVKYNQHFSVQTGYSTNFNRRKEYINHSIVTGIIFKF